MPHSTASSSNAASISTQFSRDTVTSSSITKKNGSSKVRPIFFPLFCTEKFLCMFQRSPARRQPIRIGSSNKICLEKILALGDSETSGSESSSESMHSDSTFAPSAPVRAQRKPKVSSPKTRGQQRKTERDKSPIAKRLRRGVTPSAKRASRTPSTNSSRKSTGSSNVSKKEPLEKGRALERSKTVARCPGRRVGESKEKVGVKDAGSNEKRGTSPSAMQGERSSQGKQTGANGRLLPLEFCLFAPVSLFLHPSAFCRVSSLLAGNYVLGLGTTKTNKWFSFPFQCLKKINGGVAREEYRRHFVYVYPFRLFEILSEFYSSGEFLLKKTVNGRNIAEQIL